MSKKKTREQKIKAATRKQRLGLSDLPKSYTHHSVQFGYDPKLIRKDLLKTLLVCGLILGVELMAYWWLNG